MPTGELSVAQWALAAIQAGKTATEGLAEFRLAGGHIGNQTWFRVTAELQASLANREGIYNEPTHRVPTPDEIMRWTTQRARGFIQQVEVLVRDKATGEVISVPFSLTGRKLRSRAAVIKQALGIYSGDNASKYEQQVLGAVYTGTYEAVPEGE
jgi:hypothetical protein